MLKSIRMLFAFGLVFTLVGCVTITGSPREEHVVYQDNVVVDVDSPLSKSVSVGDVNGFKGTSVISLRFKVNPNPSNKEFASHLEKSLDNANLLGEDDYTLSAELVDSDNFPVWGTSLGHMHRNVAIEYTLVDKNQRVVFNKIITGDGSTYNENFFEPFYLTERGAAEKGYGDNISILIRELIELEL